MKKYLSVIMALAIVFSVTSYIAVNNVAAGEAPNPCLISPIPCDTGSISGMKFNDLNSNGDQDGAESGLSGWTITLRRANAAGPFLTTTTDKDGNYSFSDLTDDTYYVCEENKGDNWIQTLPGPTTGDGPTTTNGPSGPSFCNFGSGYEVTVDQGNQKFTSKDFGNHNEIGVGTGGDSISGKKFNDLNGDGVENGDEQGLSDWTIDLYSISPTSPLLTVTTNNKGDYSFTNLDNGTYLVCEEKQSGWQQQAPKAKDGVSNCPNGTLGYVIEIPTPSPSPIPPSYDFGNQESVLPTPNNTGSISGMKFSDTNSNGVNDSGDSALSGWTITLDGISNSDEEVHLTTTTNDSGHYTFSEVQFGSYDVCEVMQSTWSQTLPSTDQTEGKCQGGNGYHVDLNNDHNAFSDQNFGNHQAVTSHHGGGGGGSNGGNPPGTVLGASTDTSDCQLGDFFSRTTGATCPVATATSCPAYLTSYLGYGKPNPSDQVVKLQSFLNTFQTAGLPTTGFFGNLTLAAVKAFQVSQADHIRAPWEHAGLPIPDSQWPTGYVYKTTQWWINTLNCPAGTGNFPVPPLP